VTARSIVTVPPADARKLIERAVTVANHVAIGQTVKPADRNNLGVVVALDDAAGRVTVEFTSEAGRSAQRSFDWEELTIIEPKHPVRRSSSAEASTTLDRIVDGHQESIDRWNNVLAGHHVAPDDPHVYRRAVTVHVDRAAANLAAHQPEWLTEALGHRPMAPAAAQVWDDAVRSIAGYRGRHGFVDERSPLGPPPIATDLLAEWASLTSEIDGATAWLAEYNPVPSIQPRVRTVSEIADRRTELDAIIATAPGDQRSTIAALVGGQLTLTDTDDLLREALSQQGDRRRWILEHWPHIVEAVELDAMDTLSADSVDQVLEIG
jgi:hypothetical protein